MTRRPAVLTTFAIFALTVVQLFIGAFGTLQQFDGKGFGYRLAAYPVLMLAVPLGWWWATARRGPVQNVPWTAFALVMAPFLIDVTGNTLDLYDTIDSWDNLNHFANWALLMGGIGLLIARLDVRPRWLLVLAVTGIGATLAILWEIGEWWTFIRRGVELEGAYEDTLADEILGTAGALVAGLLVAWRQQPHRSSRRSSRTDTGQSDTSDASPGIANPG